jgi:hypothetical protein
MPTPSTGGTMPPDHPPHPTGHPTLDAVLSFWTAAHREAEPPAWIDIKDRIWHRWTAYLVLVEDRQRTRPARCAIAWPVATTLLGLPMGFTGALPEDNPRTVALTYLTRMTVRRRGMLLRGLPLMFGDDGKLNRPWVMGSPLAPAVSPACPGSREQVLFAVVPSSRHITDEAIARNRRNTHPA